jgi:hypothetical protein
VPRWPAVGEALRIEWRETEEQAEASVSIARALSARIFLVYGALCVVGVLGQLLIVWRSSGLACCAAVLGVFLALFAYFFCKAYWNHRAKVAPATVRGWIAKHARRAEGFREPARDDEEGTPRFVVLGEEWLETGSKDSGELRMHWSAVTRVSRSREGHVSLLARRGSVGLFVPAWAFEADEQRAQFIAYARSKIASARLPLAVPQEFEPVFPEIALSIPFSWSASRHAYRLDAVACVGFVVLAFTVSISLVMLLMPHSSSEVGAWVWGLVLFAPPSLTALWTISWVRAFVYRGALMRHVVHQLRFNERGVSFASAIRSWTRPWSLVTVVDKPYLKTIAFNEVTVAKATFSERELARILEWKYGANAPAPVAPVAPKKKRTLILWVVLIAMFVGVYYLVTKDETALAPQIDQPEPAVATCALEPSVLAGVRLQHRGYQSSCYDLTLSEGSALIACAAVPSRTLDRVAIVVRPGARRVSVWLRHGGEWADAGTIARWEGDYLPFFDDNLELYARQLGVGEAPEILVSIDAQTGVVVRRYVSLVTLQYDVQPRVWWTILAGDNVACWKQDVDIPIEDAAESTNRLSIESEDPIPAGAAPVGTYQLGDLVRYDVFAADR